MFSLKGAPELNKPQKKAFSYDVALVPPGAEAEAESRIPSGRAEPDPEPQKSKKDKSDRKHKKKDKKEKEKKPKKHVEEDHRELSDDYSSEASTPAKKAVASKESSYNDDYEDDFEFEPEAVEDDDDFIPPVPSQKKTPPSIASTAVDTKIQERKVEELRSATEAHDRSVAQWKVEQNQKEEELEVKQKELMKQMALFQEKQDSMVSQVANIVNQQASSGEKRTIVSNADEPAGAKSQDEIQKQRRRDREHALLLKRLEEGESTNALFQKLAFDVREVFSELNLAVVAAEKERLIKDERYRREREMKDRREDEQRSQKLEKEISEREKRDADFREYIDQQMKREEEERESRLRRDLEDRAARLRSDKEQREELDRIERDRRLQAEREVQRRDDSALQTQLEEIKLRYHAQLEDYRRQADLDRSHSEELHRTELQMMEKRHEAALNQLSQKHVEQIAHLETHVVNANKLEKLIDNVRTEIDATKKMNERLTEERLNVVRQKETQVEEQKALLNAMLDDTRLSKQELDKERLRVSSMLAKFELAISSFAKNAEEDRHALKSSQDHYETLRQQAEKDRRLMLTEITQERKLLEAQHEEFLSKKMDAMTELQAERTLLSRERAESVALRERQNKDEGETLKLLRAREEEYRHKVESMEDDRTVTRDMKNEQKRLYDSSVAEREALRKERELFELEKEELLGQFNSIRQQAEDASRAQERLRNELVKERSTKQFSPFRADGEARHMDAAMTHATSRLQMDLAKQRAILTKIAS